MRNRLRVTLTVAAAAACAVLFGGLGLYLSGHVLEDRPEYSPRIVTDGVKLKPLAAPGSPAGGKRE
jgi:hypothetical protein